MPEQTFITDSIINSLKLELNNQNVKENFSDLIDSMIKVLKFSKSSSHMLWPYQTFDSALYIVYESFDDKTMRFKLIDRKPVSIIKLCHKKINGIRNLVNNPNYFSYGLCGTPIAEVEINFYLQGKVFSRIEFACGHGQIQCEP